MLEQLFYCILRFRSLSLFWKQAREIAFSKGKAKRDSNYCRDKICLILEPFPLISCSIMNPYSLSELRAAILESHADFAAYLRSLPLEVFLSPISNTWSPLQHAQHVMTPEKLLAGTLTGRKFKPLETPAISRSYEEVAAAYRQALKTTTLTSNPFPPPEYATLDALEATRGLFLSEWLQSGAALEAALAGYSDAELDAFEGRHPAMGWLLLREFMLFIVYHVVHHRTALEGRLG